MRKDEVYANDYYLKLILNARAKKSFVGNEAEMHDEIFREFFGNSNLFEKSYITKKLRINCITRGYRYLFLGNYLIGNDMMAFDDFNLYIGESLDEYGGRIKFRPIDEINDKEKDACQQQYRKYMIENLDKIQEGLGEKYQQELILKLKLKAKMKLDDLQTQICNVETKLNSDIKFLIGGEVEDNLNSIKNKKRP